MSNAALAWAFSCNVSRSSDKFILVALANYADDMGICYPSQTKLVGDTALDRKTIIAGLRRLSDVGLIADTGARKGVTGQIVIYRLIGVAGPVSHYTYRTTDVETGQYYIGKRSYEGDPQADTYRGSGKWVLLCQERGRMLAKEITARFDTSVEALRHELVLFRESDDDPLCMNEGLPSKSRARVMANLAAIQNRPFSPPQSSPQEAPNSPENGIIAPDETVPFFPPNSPVFPVEESRFSHLTVPKTGHGTPNEPSGNHQEPPPLEREAQRERVSDAIEIWNGTCAPKLPEVRKPNDQRRRALAARLRDDFGNDLDQWRAYCATIVASDKLTGSMASGWVATFDWALKPANVTKVLEGNYANRKAVQPKTEDRFAWAAAIANGVTEKPEFDMEFVRDEHGNFRSH